MTTPANAPEPPALDTPEQEDEWWKGPSLPWEHKPTREDLWCWGAIGASGIYGLAMMPLRPYLLKFPIVATLVNGSRLGLASIGALAAVSDGLTRWLPILVVLGALSTMKWSPVFWWAGKLWGGTMLDLMTQDKPRWRRVAQRVETFTLRHPVLAIGSSYVVPQISGIVSAVCGISRMRFWRFFVVQYVCSLISASTVVYIGWRIGEPAVRWLRMYSNVAFYIALAMLVVMFWVLWRKSAKRTNTDEPSPSETDPARCER